MQTLAGSGPSLIKIGAECYSGDSRLDNFYDTPERSGVQACAEATQAAGGLFFIYGTGSRKGKCYVEHTSSDSCPEGWRHHDYDFYSLAADTSTDRQVSLLADQWYSYELLHYGTQVSLRMQCPGIDGDAFPINAADQSPSRRARAHQPWPTWPEDADSPAVSPPVYLVGGQRY